MGSLCCLLGRNTTDTIGLREYCNVASDIYCDYYSSQHASLYANASAHRVPTGAN